VGFDIYIGNVDASFYDQASSTLNSWFKTSRRADTFIVTASDIARAQGVTFTASGVQVDTSSPSYSVYCSGGGAGCTSSSDSSSPNTGLVVGLVVAAVVCCLCICAAGIYMYMKKKKEEKKKEEAPGSAIQKV
jgi:hypothetical protein